MQFMCKIRNRKKALHFKKKEGFVFHLQFGLLPKVTWTPFVCLLLLITISEKVTISIIVFVKHPHTNYLLYAALYICAAALLLSDYIIVLLYVLYSTLVLQVYKVL